MPRRAATGHRHAASHAGLAGIDRGHPVRPCSPNSAQVAAAGGECLPVQPRLFGVSRRAPFHADRLQVLDDDGAGRVRTFAAGPVMTVATHHRDLALDPAQLGAGDRAADVICASRASGTDRCRGCPVVRCF